MTAPAKKNCEGEQSADQSQPIQVAFYGRTAACLDGTGESGMEKQLDCLREYLATHRELQLVDTYLDEGVSGRTDIFERPEGKRLLADARASRFSILLVQRMERLGRYFRVVVEDCQRLKAVGVGVLSLSEDFDATTPGEKLLLEVIRVLDGHCRESLSESVRRGKRAKVEAGYFSGGTPPFGYKVGPGGVLEPDEPSASVVRSIFRRAADGASLGDIARELNAQRLSTRGGRSWSSSAVQRTLRNEVYMGRMVQRINDSRVSRPGRHAPIVDDRLFRRAQVRLDGDRGEQD